MHVPLTEVILRHGGMELTRATLPPGEYVIGREPGVDLRADTPLLSRKHARLTINYDHLLLEDLASSNGTFVNDRPLAEPTRLFPNQSVRLGPDITLEVRRQRPKNDTFTSLPPAQAAIARHLPEELLGEKRYAIGGIVAQGGMGAILDARQRAIDRTVAMKVMLATDDEASVLRFIDEAKITGQLDHPNIVPIHDLGVDEQGQVFYTMKFVRGITLMEVLNRLADGDPQTAKKHPLPALLTVFQKVCDALAFAHSKGVIHRDLKPANLMLGGYGEVLVMDWGLAKVITPQESSAARIPAALPENAKAASAIRSARNVEPGFGGTMDGAIMGTLQYMPPEQARGDTAQLDSRADIYALGAILFEIVHLRKKLPEANQMPVLLESAARGDVAWTAPDPQRRSREAKLPQSLLAICRKALAVEAAARYRSVEDLQTDLLAYQNGFATSAEKAGAWKQFTLLVKRHKAASLGAAAVLLVGSTLGTKAVIEGLKAKREGDRATAALTDLKKTAPTMLALGATEADAQRFESALEKLDAALALDPALSAARWRRAWVLAALERFPEAAEATRAAHVADPAQGQLAAILPTLEAIAAAPPAARWTPDRGAALLAHMRQAGASGETVAIARRLKLGSAEKKKLIEERLRPLAGPGAGEQSNLNEDGTITVAWWHESLEPLRGLPLDHLAIRGARVSSLEPLRGMVLRTLDANNVKGITDLSPLAGMPLEVLVLGGTAVHDLAPLAGMPLRKLYLGDTKVADLSPLRGAPLTKLEINGTSVQSLEPLRGMRLKFLVGTGQASDLSPLEGMPLEEFAGSGTDADISALRGMPLKRLDIVGTRDLSPLAGMTLDHLRVSMGKPKSFGALRDVRIKEIDLFDGIQDLTPLQTTGVVTLNLDRAREVKDLTPLFGCTDLETFTINATTAPVGPLRAHPKLKFIGYSTLNGTPVLKPVAKFWADYDAQQAKGK